MLETARGGACSHEYALQAARLQSLSRDMQDCDQRTGPDVEADDPMQQLEQRLSTIALQPRNLVALANEIGRRAHCDTSYLQFEDVESRVVVYSKHDARDLRAQLARIDELRQALQREIAADREKLASTADAIEHRLSDQRTRSKKMPCPDR